MSTVIARNVSILFKKLGFMNDVTQKIVSDKSKCLAHSKIFFFNY